MEPQERRIGSPLRTRRRTTTSGPEEDHSWSGRSNGWAECREKKSGIEPKGRFFLLTFPFIGLFRLSDLPGIEPIAMFVDSAIPAFGRTQWPTAKRHRRLTRDRR